jgi:twitching motility protein PilT
LPLLDSLIAAVVRSNGDGLVMHVGERPYVVTPGGTTNLSDRPMSVEAMSNVLTDLLTAQDNVTLKDMGVVEKDVKVEAAPGEVFHVVAARGGDDIWVEFRRVHPAPRSAGPAATQASPPSAAPPAIPVLAPPALNPKTSAATPAPPAVVSAPPVPPPVSRSVQAPPKGPLSDSPTVSDRAAVVVPPRPVARPPAPVAPRPPQPAVSEPQAGPPARDVAPAVVLPLARSPIRPESGRTTPGPTPRHLGVGRLLRTAAARGATSLYLMAEARPSIRVDDDVLVLDTEPPLSTPEVEALVLELAPSGSREALAGGNSAEWVCELPDVGRIRCLSFRDQRGPGAVFRLMPSRLLSADQLGLSRDIQALCGERDGLILVAGPRLSGKSTLVSAFVDLINRNRSDYVITLESEIKFVHENRKALVSQREVRGDAEGMVTRVRSALRENPDVLVVDELRNAEVAALALEAADSGHLVIGTVTAHTTMTAIARLIEAAPLDRQGHLALGLSETLRGAVAQVLLRKSGGGRVAARELLLNTPSVASLLAEGKVGQLSLAIESGRKYGMIPMNDALAAFVQSGAVDAREAYRKAYDRVAFVEVLKKDGIDTSFVERLA